MLSEPADDDLAQPLIRITIHLLDKDDFEITSLEITLDQLTRTVNPKGDGIGFSIQGAEKMSLRTYRRIDDWKISWNL